jgi:3-hydroxyisobutyrate dehydrogenase
MNVGLLGVGLMGAAIAERLHEKGHAVRVWNRTESSARPLEELGIAPQTTPAEVLVWADRVILTLSDANAIRDVLFAGDAGPALAGQVVVQMGTIAPDESRSLARQVSGLGGRYLEAPVLGSIPEARSGRLIIMAGGDPLVFEDCRDLLGCLGECPSLVGDTGKGAALKLAMNQLIAALTAGFSLSLGLVRAEGIDVDRFMGLLRASALYAPTYDKKLDRMLTSDYGRPNFPLKHLLKDVALFQAAAEVRGIDAGLLEPVREACERARAAGLGEADYSAIYEAVTGNLAESGG